MTRSFLAVLMATGFACGPRPALDAQIDSLFRSAHEGGRFDGAVLVTRGGRTLYEGAFGFADVATGAPNQAETRFLAFSVVKPMTAILIFQQIEVGVLHLDDRLDDPFPNLKGGRRERSRFTSS